MGDKSSIEWTDATWTPLRARNLATGRVGWHCTHMSEGCRLCYAEAINRRLGTGLDFKPVAAREIELFLDEAMLRTPIRWRKPRMVFVCSMTDLFGDFVPVEQIDRVWAVMALAYHHTYQVLTKRSGRQRAYLSDPEQPARVAALLDGLKPSTLWNGNVGQARLHLERGPLPNVWVGVSAEEQSWADARIPDLRRTPAAVRFVSFEPLLSAISDGGGWRWSDIDQAIVGGESGTRGRAVHPVWVREIRDGCAEAGTAFFFKQWGQHQPIGPVYQDSDDDRTDAILEACAADDGRSQFVTADGRDWPDGVQPGPSAWVFRNVGRKAAGRLLDGRAHEDLPVRP